MSRFERQIKSLDERVEDLERAAEPPNIPRDPLRFFMGYLRLKPYPYQARFLRDQNPLKVLRWPRRAGKTTIMAGTDLHHAARTPSTTIICTMPKFQQVKEIYFYALHEHLARMPEDKYEDLIDEELQTIIRFRNKTRILAEAPEPFTIRGHGPSKISIDEMNFIRKDNDLWLSALLPMTLTQTVYINVASTPWNKDSIYYKMCFDNGFRTFSGNACEHDPPRYFLTYRDVLKPNGPLDPAQVEMMREQYAGNPWRWKREMECAFVDDETAFLPSSLIIKCQNESLDFARFEDNIVGKFFVGWDLGRERDPGAIAIIDLAGDVCRLMHCRSFKLGTPYVSQMAYIKSVCDRWRYINAVAYDHTGTKGIDEEIERAGFPALEGVDFTKPKKHGMAMTLKQLMMTSRKADKGLSPHDARRRFELPYDQDVQAELNVVQWEQTKGSEVYTFSHPEGSHDDRFWAIALAVMAAIKGADKGCMDAFRFG
ncbi:MAG: terminase family protein [Candidatus Bathyarchaeota archaeon]|nr:terminase family protein [Candidatus Bathyarchaeota archaeon]